MLTATVAEYFQSLRGKKQRTTLDAESSFDHFAAELAAGRVPDPLAVETTLRQTGRSESDLEREATALAELASLEKQLAGDPEAKLREQLAAAERKAADSAADLLGRKNKLLAAREALEAETERTAEAHEEAIAGLNQQLADLDAARRRLHAIRPRTPEQQAALDDLRAALKRAERDEFAIGERTQRLQAELGRGLEGATGRVLQLAAKVAHIDAHAGNFPDIAFQLRTELATARTAEAELRRQLDAATTALSKVRAQIATIKAQIAAA